MAPKDSESLFDRMKRGQEDEIPPLSSIDRDVAFSVEDIFSDRHRAQNLRVGGVEIGQDLAEKIVRDFGFTWRESSTRGAGEDKNLHANGVMPETEDWNGIRGLEASINGFFRASTFKEIIFMKDGSHGVEVWGPEKHSYNSEERGGAPFFSWKKKVVREASEYVTRRYKKNRRGQWELTKDDRFSLDEELG